MAGKRVRRQQVEVISEKEKRVHSNHRISWKSFGGS